MMKNQHEGEESSPPRFSARNGVEKHNSTAARARDRKQIVATFLQN
jgi:hypothetical protein